MAKKRELPIGYYPLMQVSRPNLAAGLPRGRWVYCNRAHALSVLQEFFDRKDMVMPPQFAPGPSPKSNGRPWLLVVQIPPRTKVAEVMRRHTFGLLLGKSDSITERFPAYRLMQSATVLDVIEIAQDEEWVAIQVQRAMQN